MPMYEAPKMDGGGQVLDLETAVKDGILGGGKMSSVSAASEKLDLNSMMEELSSIEVPSVFICPISLSPMRDPVTLCTGQTYERANIIKWMSMGHKTCPTTMQELWDDSVTPNRTLYQLIVGWFSQKYLAMRKRSEDVQGRVLEVLDGLRKLKGKARVSALKELRNLVARNPAARKAVTENGGVAVMVSLLGPFTSYAVGSEVVCLLVNLGLDSPSRRNLMQPARVSLMVDMLNEGSVETKVNCVKLIENLMEGKDFLPEVVSSLSLLFGLLRLLKDKRHPSGVQHGLSLLRTISSHESVRRSIVSIGAVPQLVEMLPSLKAECLESALKILGNLLSVPEGRVALKDCPNTIPNAVKLLMGVSENCTQLALSILFAVCKLAPEDCASVAVEAGMAAKLLLVIQSGCNPALKQQSAELLKLCSLNYTATIFISKCKLTRTLQ